MSNTVYSINGPVVKMKDTRDFSMMEMVYVGNKKLVGEVIGITDAMTTIQVYESTTGLKPGEPVYSTGAPLSVTLGPGILQNIYDGIQRPLQDIAAQSGAFIDEGSSVSPLDEKKTYPVTLKVRPGDYLKGGMVYATCPETPIIEHRCMLSPLLEGEVIKVSPDGDYTINDVVAVIRTPKGEEKELTLCQKWPIRTPRPVA